MLRCNIINLKDLIRCNWLIFSTMNPTLMGQKKNIIWSLNTGFWGHYDVTFLASSLPQKAVCSDHTFFLPLQTSGPWDYVQFCICENERLYWDSNFELLWLMQVWVQLHGCKMRMVHLPWCESLMQLRKQQKHYETNCTFCNLTAAKSADLQTICFLWTSGYVTARWR